MAIFSALLFTVGESTFPVFCMCYRSTNRPIAYVQRYERLVLRLSCAW